MPSIPQSLLWISLVVLWLFVLAALRVVRSDLYAASGLRAIVSGGRRPPRDRARRVALRALPAAGPPPARGRGRAAAPLPPRPLLGAPLTARTGFKRRSH